MPISQVDDTLVMPKYSHSTPLKKTETDLDNDVHVLTPATTDLNESLTSSDSISSENDDFDGDSTSTVSELAQKLDKVHVSEEVSTGNVTVTEHRRLELEGKLKPEPLLVENPGRFVLFPIQNPEVSTF